MRCFIPCSSTYTTCSLHTLARAQRGKPVRVLLMCIRIHIPSCPCYYNERHIMPQMLCAHDRVLNIPRRRVRAFFSSVPCTHTYYSTNAGNLAPDVDACALLLRAPSERVCAYAIEDSLSSVGTERRAAQPRQPGKVCVRVLLQNYKRDALTL